MNTLSKYDIADIVSHISGKTQPADARSSDGETFADLLREAVKNIPQSNAEGKAAESGKSLPESPLRGKDLDSRVSAGSVVESELHTLLREALSRTHSESSVDVRVSDTNDSEQQSEIKRQENSDLIDNLRAALKFQGQKDAEIGSEEISINKATSLTHTTGLAAEGSDSIDDQIRVATLKQRRPVILGPGSPDEQLRSQIMANYFKDDSFLRNELANDLKSLESEVTSNQNLLRPSSENLLGATNQSEKVDWVTEAAAQQKNFIKRSDEISDVDLKIPLKNQTSKQNNYDKASAVNDESKIGLASAQNVDTEGLVLSEKRGSAEVTGSFLESRHQLKQLDITTQHQESSGFVARDGTAKEDSAQVISNNITRSERFQEESNAGDQNNEELPFRHSITKSEFKSREKDTADQSSRADQNPVVSKADLLIGDAQREPQFRSTNFNPQEFDPSAGAYQKVSSELRPTQAQHNFETKDGGRAEGVQVENHLASAIKKKESGTEFRKGSVTEYSDVFKNPSRESALNAEFEIRINEPAKRHIDQTRLSVLDPNLTVEESDPSINTPKGESVDALKSETIVSLQSERPVISSRPEVSQRTVSVSNFSSEMQESIMGQLTKTATGTSKFTVALFPENLGRINIEISYSDLAGLKITMIGDNPEATKILEQNLPTLRENLQTDKLNELLVNLNNNRDSSGSNQKHSQSEGGNFASKEDKEAGNFDFTDPNSKTRGETTNDLETGLDTYV